MLSMLPNIAPDERIIVNKLIYRLTPPKRGEIITFDSPDKPVTVRILGLIPVKRKKILIKRIIGLSGEKIEIKSGKLYIDGRFLKEGYLRKQDIRSSYGPIIIPRDEVFVLGDNRDNSRDSRTFGPIQKSDILGKAFIVYWPLKSIRIVGL